MSLTYKIIKNSGTKLKFSPTRINYFKGANTGTETETPMEEGNQITSLSGQ
jgi:hypothetical protein